MHFQPDETTTAVMRHFTQLEVLWRDEKVANRFHKYVKVMRENLPEGVELEWMKYNPFSAKFHHGGFTYMMTARDNKLTIGRRRKREWT